MRTRSLRVCLDARIPDGTHGGVQQVIIGLAHGFASLPPGPEEYLFLVKQGQWDWLRPHLGGPCRPLEVEGSPGPYLSRFRRLATNLASRVFGRGPVPGAAESDGTVEQAGADVVHLTLQDGFRTRIPSIYMPYDLQHVHLPEFFSTEERAARDAVYPDLCRRAACVVAISRWGRDDLVRMYQLPPSRVRTVYLAPAVDAYAPPSQEEITQVRRRLGVPETFVLFPAQTWPHKNHRTLLEALAVLRQEWGQVVPLVLTGTEGGHFPEIRRHIDALGLAEQVSSLGFVSPGDLVALYTMCRMLVFPSLFEGFGMPIVEAFRLGVPVAASTATCLPEIAGDAALLFDPRDPRAMAATIRELWTDRALREDLAGRGRRRAEAFTWSRTAAAFRAIYRETAGRVLDDGDRAALASSAQAPHGPVLRSGSERPG